MRASLPARTWWALALVASLCLSHSAALAEQAAAEKTAPSAGPSAPVEPTGPVTLQDAIRIAKQNHGSVVVAREAVAVAQGRVTEARAGTLPNVSGDVTFQGRGSSLVNRGNGALGRSGTTWDPRPLPRLSVNYTLYDGGQTAAGVRQARAGVAESQAGEQATLRNLALTVASSFVAQLRAESLLDLRQAQEKLAQEQLDRVEARISAGSAAEADRALPLSEVRSAQVARIQAENDAKVAATALRNAMGLSVGPPLKLVQPAGITGTLPSQNELMAEAEKMRPELQQARARVASAAAGLTLAKLRRYPLLDVTAAYQATPSDPTQRASWAIGLGISMPIWDANVTRAREEEARAQLVSATADMEQTRKDIAAEVEQAYLNLVSARERLGAATAAADAAKVNLDATSARYERGVAGVSVVDLFAAQVQYDTANVDAIQAQYDVLLAQAQLDRAVGRMAGTGQ